MSQFRGIEDGDIEAVVKLWQACGLTRPWNDPYKDISFARRGRESTILVCERNGAIAASVMVGHSGPSTLRRSEVTASALARPDLICGAIDETASIPNGTSPPASAVEAGPPPLYGMWTRIAPLTAASCSATM